MTPMVLLEDDAGTLIMVPRDPSTPVYVPPTPCPAWLDDGDARAAVAMAPPPPDARVKALALRCLPAF